MFQEKVDFNLLCCFPKNDEGIRTKKIYIYELDCNIIMYLTRRDCFVLETNIAKRSLQYVQIKNHNLFKKFDIYLTATSSLINTSILKSIFNSFILNDKNFMFYYLKSLYDEKVLKYSLLTSNNYYQMSQFNVLNNYKLLNYFTITDYLFHIFLTECRWNIFWLRYGKAVSYLSWILKYKDYINTDDMCSFNRTSRVLTNDDQKQMVNSLLVYNIVIIIII
jgi:hypothetical protein